MTRLAGIDIDAPPVVVAPIFLLALLVVSFIAARVVRALTRRWLKDEAPALGIPVGAAVLINGLQMILPEISLPGRTGHWVGGALDIALVLACALGLSRIAVAALTAYAARNPSVSPALGVARGIVRIAVTVLAAIMALEAVGVPVAPLLTTLGIGSLAVALALQDTLANFFAGVHLLADRPVRPGDYIKLHDGEEGFVETIGWRSSRLRTTRNNIVVVPNQKLSQAILTNFHLPVASVTMTVSLTVEANADPAAVEKAFADELGRAVIEVEEIGDAKPVVRLSDVTDVGQVWQCTVDARDVEAQGLAGHEIRKRLLARLRRENIALAAREKVFLQSDGAKP